MTGWSIDPNSTAPINVDLYVDGKFVTRTLAGVDRPDVGNIYFAYGTTHGFDTTVDLPAGQHQICAYGINVGAGTTNPKLGCIGATVPTNNPIGSLNTASGKAGVLTVQGWTIDPDTAAPLTVAVYVDGKLTGETTANVSRPDVAKRLPGVGCRSRLLDLGQRVGRHASGLRLRDQPTARHDEPEPGLRNGQGQLR